MAKVAGTAQRASRRRIPRLRPPQAAALVLLAPAAWLAPDPFLRAVAVAVAVAAAWGHGYLEGRAAHAREVLIDAVR